MTKDRNWRNGTWLFLGWEDYSSKLTMQVGKFVFVLRTREAQRKKPAKNAGAAATPGA